ncbi:ATPase [Azospirillum sp. TSO5]|nr:ATPase [Azospirillum sp. TSO5]
MSEPALLFSEHDALGVIAAVDTGKATVEVRNPSLLTRVGVGNLVAIRGATEQEFLIGLVERVTRCLRDELIPIDGGADGSVELAPTTSDQLQAVLIGTFRTVDGSRRNTFKRGADSFPQIDRDCYYVEGANLQRFMGLLGAELEDGQRLKLGHFVADRTAVAIASGDRFFQRHAAILGSTGSGKSWAVALLLERASKLAYPNIIVLDMHGEYAPLCNTEKGGFAARFRIAGPGDLSSSPSDALFLPYWLLNRDEMLAMILDRSDNNAPNQASRFSLHIRDLKHATLVNEGKGAVAETFTLDSPIPYPLDLLLGQLRHDNTAKGMGKDGKPVKGDWEGQLTRFIARLEAKIDDRRYGFMFKPPAPALGYGWLVESVSRLLCSGNGRPGIKVVDFSEVPADVLPVVTGVFARLLYDVQFWMDPSKRTPVTLLCDEAHLYLPTREDADAVQKQALGAFERISKEGRKYGFSLLVVSQRPSDVSKTILSQCNNFLSLRLTNETDQGVVRKLMPDSLAGMTEMLPLLDIGEALLLGDATLLPSRIKLDRPIVEPDSATRNFWTEWGTREPSMAAIGAAVESLRRQTRS